MSKHRRLNLVSVQINADDLAYIAQKLEHLAYILNCSAEDDDPELPPSYWEDLLEDAQRCQEVAKSIASAGRVNDGP